MASVDSTPMMHTAMIVTASGVGVDVEDAASLSYDEFCARYMAGNRPVRLLNVVARWFRQASEWRTEPAGGIRFDLLREQYGHHDVPVVDGETVAYGSHSCKTMKFADYLDLLQAGRAGKQYLKDWHFVQAESSRPPVYITPTFFQDDWLNCWWDHKEKSSDDYRFVYIGPAGSWTPLHHDVFRSYSWSVNITGRKQWIFFHPNEEWKLKDKFGRSVLPDFTDPDYDRDMYPNAHKAEPLYVTQEAGEAIFVPSGWYHQVQNLADTISINHNWFNGYNIDEIWSFLQQEYFAVEQELEHLQELGLTGREFRDQCQIVMHANTGMNYVEFQELLTTKAVALRARIQEARTEELSRRQVDEQHLLKVKGVLEVLLMYFDDETSTGRTRGLTCRKESSP